MAEFRRLRQRFASFEEFRADVDTRELCVHYLRIALESVLDVCRHFLGAVEVEAMRQYRRELREFPHPRSLRGIETLARMRGMQAGYEAAEAFALVRDHWD